MSERREIGGYLELERFFGEHYHANAIALNCGRGCLAYETELRAIRTIWIPDLMCDCVPALFRREGVSVRTYRIGGNLLPIYDFEVANGEWLLLMDYYGQLTAADVERGIAASRGHLIVDESQGFFRRPWEGVDTVYTCRKWFGVADGGYLATSDGSRLTRKLTRDESHARMGFVLGRLERPAGEFFAESGRNNDFFDCEPARFMSLTTDNLMRAISYTRIRAKRDANWASLEVVLGRMNALSLHVPEGAFMYPLMIDDAQRVRKYLISRGVFVPMLWPNVPFEQSSDSWARRMTESVLPLPVDQRYGEEEMEYVSDLVLEALS